jgi:hypothetical protein
VNPKFTIRTIILLNATFWVIALLFPFSRFLSEPSLRRLSYLFADMALFFPAILLLLVIFVCWRYRRSLSSHKYDIVLAVIAVAADAWLIPKV